MKNTKSKPYGKFLRCILVVLMLSLVCSSNTAKAAPDYQSVDAAIEQLRTAMIQRKTAIVLYVRSEADFSQAHAVSDLLFKPVFEDNQGSKYNAGDYLRAAWCGHTSCAYNEGSGRWRIEIYDIHYRTVSEQEKEFDAALKAVVDELDIWTKSDVLKCQAIYSYITSHVSYDYDAYTGVYPSDSARKQMSYTAYAALFHEYAVCAGYAQLFYAMAHSVGLHVRIVHGEALGKNGWAAHAWNAVELAGKWYQLDCTWDANDEMDEWDYFLKGNPMPKHQLTQPTSGLEMLSASDYIFSPADYMPVGRFKDVSYTDSCFTGAQYLAECGVMTGTVNGYTFSPGDYVTRGMCVEVLYRIAGKPEAPYSDVFPDVKPEDYYWNAARWASSEGITAGYQDGDFHPSDFVSTEQMVTMLYRYFGCPESTPGPYPLALDTVSTFARDAVCWSIGTHLLPTSYLTPEVLSSPVPRSLLAEVMYSAAIRAESLAGSDIISRFCYDTPAAS